MLSLRPQHNRHSPSKWQYRLSRFMLSKIYWGLTRVVTPLIVVAFVGFQLWTSDAIRTKLEDAKNGIYSAYAHLPFFMVDELKITNATLLREAEIREMVGIDLPISSLEVDRQNILAELKGLDAVGAAAIRFNYSGVMEIALTPRVPVMTYFDGTEFVTVDIGGHRVAPLKSRSDHPEFFVISGKGATDATAEALRLTRSISPVAGYVRGLVRVGERRWDIVLVNGGKLMLPADDPIEALKLILERHKADDVLNRGIKAFDMRAPDRPILRMSEDAQTELERIQATTLGQGA